jgi:superfamily II DNA or RNA helicase
MSDYISDKEQEILIRQIKRHEPKQPIVIKVIPKKRTSSLLREGFGTIEELNMSSHETYTEILPDKSTIVWVLPHSKRFIDFIKNHFGKNPKYISKRESFIKEIIRAMESGSDAPPFAYQQFIRDYMRYGTPYRSLLLEHGLGSGKTLSAILVGETFREVGLQILILTPAFLRLNFMDEIERWGGPDIRITQDMSDEEKAQRRARIAQSYHFIHYNASGNGLKKTKAGINVAGKGSVFEQLARIGIGFSKSDPDFGDLFPYLNNKYGDLKPPEKMLIIIEEVHNMNRTFIKGPGKLRSYLYPLLMKARDCKIIALSGTPIVNSPFEMASLYNLLRGPIGANGKGRTLPENEEQFNSYFVDYDAGRITNADIVLPTRILGLGSLFKGITDDPERIIYPAGNDKSERRIIDIMLPEYQGRMHDNIFADETALKKVKKRRFLNINKGDVTKAISDAQTKLEPKDSYYTRSRQACNFVFPQEVPRPRPGGKTSSGKELEAGKWNIDENYVFQFNNLATSADDLINVWEFFEDQGFDLSDYGDQFEQCSQNEDVAKGLEDARAMFTDIMSVVYQNRPPVEPKNPIKAILTDRDHEELLRHMGTYKQRLDVAVRTLLRGAQDYLTIGKLRDMYSAKMAQIYTTIISDKANGALYVDYSTQKVADTGTDEIQQEEVIDEEAVDEEEVDIDQTEKDDVDVFGIKVSKIVDPDDPMQGPDSKQYNDAYLPDSQIKGKVRGGPAMVYSFFNAVEGVGLFSKVLEAHGFVEYGPGDTDKPQDLIRAPRFAFVKGGMNPMYKSRIMRVFNSKQNAHGQLIRVIFVTQAAAEGISLFHLRQVHIMEPHWENTMIDQVIGRAFRLRSHRYLEDKEERHVRVFMYRALTANMLAGTADGLVQQLADRKTALLDQLKTCRAVAAVDCMLNSDYNKLNVPCLTLTGSGAAFTADINTDIKNTDKMIEKKRECTIQLHTDSKGNRYIELLDRPKLTLEVKHGGEIQKVKGSMLYYMTDSTWNETKPIVESQLKHWGYYFDLKINGTSQSVIYPIHKNITVL